jgi:hypothetical protein
MQHAKAFSEFLQLGFDAIAFIDKMTPNTFNRLNQHHEHIIREVEKTKELIRAKSKDPQQ